MLAVSSYLASMLMKEYIVTFKPGTIHPFDKVPMDGMGCKIVAPDLEAARIMVKHKYGNTIQFLHDPKKIDKRRFIQNGLYETLLWKAPESQKINLNMNTLNKN